MELEQELDKILAKVGLTSREREVFLSLAAHGPATLKELIVKTKLKKPTVYRVVSDLETKGFVCSDNKKYDKRYAAHEPKRLLSELGNERRKLRRLELEVEELLPQLNAFVKTSGKAPTIEIQRTHEGYVTLSNRSLDCQEKIVYYLGNLDNMTLALGKDFDREHYVPTRMKRGIAFRLLTFDAPTMREFKRKDKNENRETRFLPPGMAMDTTILIFDDTVAFFSEYKEMLALSITSPSIAMTMKVVFNDLWAHAS